MYMDALLIKIYLEQGNVVINFNMKIWNVINPSQM
jgi:hypothetical protein